MYERLTKEFHDHQNAPSAKSDLCNSMVVVDGNLSLIRTRCRNLRPSPLPADGWQANAADTFYQKFCPNTAQRMEEHHRCSTCVAEGIFNQDIPPADPHPKRKRGGVASTHIPPPVDVYAQPEEDDHAGL